MTKQSLKASIIVMLALSACGRSDRNRHSIYQSLDKKTVFVIIDNRFYLGSANHPNVADVTQDYGANVKIASDGHGNTCASYSSIVISKSINAHFICNGTEFTRSPVTTSDHKEVFRYRSVCWDFVNGACQYSRQRRKPSITVEYDVMSDGRLVNIYLAGYDNRNDSNTLVLTSDESI